MLEAVEATKAETGVQAVAQDEAVVVPDRDPMEVKVVVAIRARANKIWEDLQKKTL